MNFLTNFQTFQKIKFKTYPLKKIGWPVGPPSNGPSPTGRFRVNFYTNQAAAAVPGEIINAEQNIMRHQT